MPRHVEGRGNAPRRRLLWRSLSMYTLVALGSVIGGVLRAVASGLIHSEAGWAIPWGTVFVNVSGSFLIGFYATLSEPEGRLMAGPRQRQFVMAGICGGYTTFSVFSLETYRLAEAGDFASAGLNVGLSMVSALAAVWLGHVLAALINR